MSILFEYREGLVWGHSFFDNSEYTLVNATQTQQNENYVVGVFVIPSRPSVGRDINFTLEIKSRANDVLIELPVATYFLKHDKPVYSNPNNYSLVRQQHYDFGYKFGEPGVYSLAVDIKDIFYTLDVASFTFEIVVDGPVLDRILEQIGNYNYVFIPFIIIIMISAFVNYMKRRGTD